MLALATSLALAQDPGMMAAQQAAQQATQAAQQASQQANEQMNQAAQQANQTMMQNAQQAAQNNPPCDRCVAKPKFSVKPGPYSSALKVRMRDSTRGAIIYYTTDGWTPTASSTRYLGAITISSTTSVQAIAISPYGYRSRVATAAYILNGLPATAPAPQPVAQAPNAASNTASFTPAKVWLAQGTAVPLLFAADVSSNTAQVGDKIPMTLAEDLTADGMVVATKGTPAVATITEVDKTGMGGTPGQVSFQVDSLQAGRVLVKLHGGAAKQGQDEHATSMGLMLVPVVPVGVFVHGKQAEIKQGAAFTAFVDADTPIATATN
jgi:membrane protease subunit (stomatin/prohibitin family)